MLLSFVFPLTFVVLWASAFATGSVATQDATPFAALAFRFSLVAIGFVIVAWWLAEFSTLKMRDLKHFCRALGISLNHFATEVLVNAAVSHE